MQSADFKRIVSCFVDSPSSVDLSKGEFVIQLRDDVVTAKLKHKNGALFVIENDVESAAEAWIVDRVARVPLLASRISEYVTSVPNFVNPSVLELQNLNDDPTASNHARTDAIDTCRAALEKSLPGTTSVIYLTSDAGEGKTTLITTLAREIADSYRARKVDRLLLPISLGGRAFLRFDELVVSSLVSRLRFPYWYYEGFIELVRMGVIVPAFDGFEEMIVEGSSGEAVSALGNLMNLLNSEGTVLFAARKAFFEYQSFRTQAKLFDAIGRQDSVAFSRLTIERWTKQQFLRYGSLRGQKDSAAIYDQVVARFGVDHPLVTRAVLVRRLFDVASSLREVTDLLQHLGARPQDYFHEFVMAIIEREAGEKWLDKEGREGQSLLAVEEHLELLAAVAREMWISSTDALRQDVIDVVADLFCEEGKKSPALSRQIRERLQNHALLVATGAPKGTLSFDHEDFKNFFTGIALGKLLIKADREDTRTFLRVASITQDTADEALLIYKRERKEKVELIDHLLQLASGELPTSFVIENVGTLLMKLLDGESFNPELKVSGISFGSQTLRTRKIEGVRFSKCYFAPTGLYQTQLAHVVFESCQLERIELSDQSNISALLINCQINCVVPAGDDVAVFEPSAVDANLRQSGFDIGSTDAIAATRMQTNEDEEMAITERVIRAFLRSTQVNEQTFRVRLGNRSSIFFASVLPELLRVGVLAETPYRGAGTQSRYRLALPMSYLQQAIAQSTGNFETFLSRAASLSSNAASS